ncbi:MAG: MotA/TolQ/ExbB proton channel family protein [Muribaculaceae bacterium]|nr:MotA/TolQ/ExbB proton channel family protein [Muribaculaceae bacterium]
MTVWDTIQRGEYVMFALGVLLIISLLIWWIRAASLVKERKGYAGLMERVRDHIMEGDIENASHICSVKSSAGARMLCAGISRVGHPLNEVVFAINSLSQTEKVSMARGSRWLRAIGVISPLLGLAGTLIGVIDRLRDLGESPVPVDTAMVCSAIAPTVVTTVAGLITGIIALFSMTCLDATVESSRRSLDELANDFYNLLNEPS